jgi:hypothetical protein
MTIHEGFLAMFRAGLACDDAAYSDWVRAQAPGSLPSMAYDSAESPAERSARWRREAKQISRNTFNFMDTTMTADEARKRSAGTTITMDKSSHSMRDLYPEHEPVRRI